MKKTRHSLAHILASAVKELYPKAKLGIGPDIDNGFYYDFDNLKNPDLKIIEKKMKELIKKDIKFKKKKITKIQAKKLFKDEPYKLDLLKDLKDITIYESDKFIDLCAGSHIKSTKEINIDSFKLDKIAGAYWKGDEKNKMLTRIYGLAFENKKELDKYLKLRIEAEKRDHRKLGESLELFLLDEEIGQGLPLWLPKGALIRKIIENYLYKELSSEGYDWLYTPHIGNLNLWKKSGHWNFYKENLYSPIDIDEEKYLLKPMNCPFHVKAYNSKIRSYKDLPIKFAELGTVYRYERSGTLHGLTRVRGFTQDDAHIICTSEKMPQELERLVKHGLKMLRDFGFKDFTIYLSTRPEKYAGTNKGWKEATDTLKNTLKKLNLSYEIDPGGGVFYGPKIDIKIKDSLDREWQCTTIQFDFNLPERFKMTYINEKGTKSEPYMIHRALLGSMERFFGVLIEHYAGVFPLWLSPIQLTLVPVNDSYNEYCYQLAEDFKKNDLRIKIDQSSETVGNRVRKSIEEKIPYILIIGEKEKKSSKLSVRSRKDNRIEILDKNSFIDKIIKEIKDKS